MSGLSGAACVGQHELFESVHPSDHIEAQRICEQCPAIAACQALLARESSHPLAPYGGPTGTWAGQLVGTKAKAREHGSERGWGQHRHYREQICEPCRLAHNGHIRTRARAS